MTLIQKLVNLQIPNIEIIQITDPQFEHHYELRTRESGIIAIGWKFDDSEDDEGYEFNSEFYKIYSENYLFANGDNLNLSQWNGLFFGLNSNHIWFCTRKMPKLYGKKQDSLDQFLNELKNKFNELKSQEEQLQEINSNLKAANIELEETIKNQQAELEKTLSEIKKQDENNQWLTDKRKDNLKEINTLKDENAKLLEAIKSISDSQKDAIIEKLTKKQKIAIAKISEDHYQYIGQHKTAQPIELNDRFIQPDILVKVRCHKTISYETEYDKIEIPTWNYFSVNKQGKITSIEISTLMQIPGTAFLTEALYIDNLLGCTRISTSDFDF